MLAHIESHAICCRASDMNTSPDECTAVLCHAQRKSATAVSVSPVLLLHESQWHHVLVSRVPVYVHRGQMPVYSSSLHFARFKLNTLLPHAPSRMLLLLSCKAVCSFQSCAMRRSALQLTGSHLRVVRQHLDTLTNAADRGSTTLTNPSETVCSKLFARLELLVRTI